MIRRCRPIDQALSVPFVPYFFLTLLLVTVWLAGCGGADAPPPTPTLFVVCVLVPLPSALVVACVCWFETVVVPLL